MKHLTLAIMILLALALSSCESVRVHKIKNVVPNKPVEVTLTTKNTVNIIGEVNEDSMSKAAKELALLRANNPKETIYIVVNSPGGSVTAGMKFITFANGIDNVKTITITAISMGSAIVEALPGERLIVPNATFMFHRAAGSVSGYFDGEIETRLAFYKSLIGALDKSNSDRIGIPLEEYKANVLREWWAYGDEAIKLNMADRVAKVKCSVDLIKAEETVIVASFFGAFEKKISKCPLL